MSDGDFEKVAALDELPDHTPVSFELANGDEICLVKVRGEVFAFENRCTHAEFPMSDGEIVDDYVIECGLHGAQFDVRTGEVVELPATDRLPCYPVKVDKGDIWVQTTPVSEE